MKTAKEDIIICPFPGIRPINTMEEFLGRAPHVKRSAFITSERVCLRPAEGVKTLHLVNINLTRPRFVNWSPSAMQIHYTELLRTCGKRFCCNSPNYLLGLLAKVPQIQMPAEIRHMHILAAEPDNSSAKFWEGDVRDLDCYLVALLFTGGYELDLFDVGNLGHHSSDCTVLAEDLAP